MADEVSNECITCRGPGRTVHLLPLRFLAKLHVIALHLGHARPAIRGESQATGLGRFRTLDHRATRVTPPSRMSCSTSSRVRPKQLHSGASPSFGHTG